MSAPRWAQRTWGASSCARSLNTTTPACTARWLDCTLRTPWAWRPVLTKTAVPFAPWADALGFGSVEVGSVSAYPSVGNAKPRLFRLPADEAIIVNYGVPNGGAQAVSQRMHKRSTDGPLGVNPAETNTGQGLEDDAVIEEFVEAVRPFCSKVDYVTLNLNCPNTTGGAAPSTPRTCCALSCSNMDAFETYHRSFSSSPLTQTATAWKIRSAP